MDPCRRPNLGFSYLRLLLTAKVKFGPRRNAPDHLDWRSWMSKRTSLVISGVGSLPPCYLGARTIKLIQRQDTSAVRSLHIPSQQRRQKSHDRAARRQRITGSGRERSRD